MQQTRVARLQDQVNPAAPAGAPSRACQQPSMHTLSKFQLTQEFAVASRCVSNTVSAVLKACGAIYPPDAAIAGFSCCCSVVTNGLLSVFCRSLQAACSEVNHLIMQGCVCEVGGAQVLQETTCSCSAKCPHPLPRGNCGAVCAAEGTPAGQPCCGQMCSRVWLPEL